MISRPVSVTALHALLLALLCSLPHWVSIWTNRGDYSPFAVSPRVSAITFDETHAYAPPAQRFMATGRLQAELDNFELRSMSAGIPFIPPALLGALGWAFGTLDRAFIAADCLFPVLLFLLLFKITRAITSDQGLRLLIAWSSVLVPFGVLNSVWLGDDALIAPLEITRTPQPEISFLVLIAAAALLGCALKSTADWKCLVGAGLASGAVVYCYYFYAVAWILTLVLLFLLGLAWESRRVWVTAAAVLAMAAALSVPFVVEAMHGSAQGGQTHLLARMGAQTHRPDLPALAAGLLLLLVLLFRGRRHVLRKGTYFALTLLVAGSLLGMNIQILTGYETQPWHFWKRLALPVCFFLLVSLVAGVATKSAYLPSFRLASRVILFLLISETAARLIYAATLVAPQHLASDPDHAMLSWIRTNLPSERVLGTLNPELILLIPALTTDYNYVPSGLRSLTSTDEIVARYFDLACLLGISPEEVARESAIPSHLHRSTEVLQVLGLSYTGDSAVFRSFVDGYRNAAHTCRAPRWQLDYLIIPLSSLRQPAIQLHFPKARLVYRNSRYALLLVAKRD